MTTPRAGDWGGIVFRNYDQAAPAHGSEFPVDGTLPGINGAGDLRRRRRDVDHQFREHPFAGGAVPQSSSNFYSAITLYNGRPAITNDKISNTGGTGGLQAAIGADMDSFREDDTARGPLIRRATVTNNSLNGIWLLAETNGFIEPTNAVPLPDNPSSLGGSQNYTFFEPLPFVASGPAHRSARSCWKTPAATPSYSHQPALHPARRHDEVQQGRGLEVDHPGLSLNVGSRSYINGFDQDPNYGPGSPGFVAESATTRRSSSPRSSTTTPPRPWCPHPINVTGETTTPTLGFSMWGSVGIESGALAVINAGQVPVTAAARSTRRTSRFRRSRCWRS